MTINGQIRITAKLYNVFSLSYPPFLGFIVLVPRGHQCVPCWPELYSRPQLLSVPAQLYLTLCPRAPTATLCWKVSAYRKGVVYFLLWIEPNLWIWNDNTYNNRRSIKLDDKWSRNIGQTACLCLILRRKGSHYSPVVCCSTLVLPHALFPHGSLSAVGYGSVGTRLYLIPAVALSLLLFLLFPLLSFLSLPTCSLSLFPPLPLSLNSILQFRHTIHSQYWSGLRHRGRIITPTRRHHRVHTTQMQTHQVISALQTSLRCLSEKLRSDRSI